MALSTPPTSPPPSSASASGAVVKCAALTKVFKDFWHRDRVRAVDGINLDINRGEVFGLLGPNGSGKSTTIKLILGLLHPTSGRVAVFGKRPEDVATKKLIGYLPEESYLYRFLNARETLDYYGRLFHQDRQQRRKRVDMLLEMVGLEATANRPIGEFSKGMQRRIGLAQALINDPELIILDEPTSGMDPIGTRQIKDLILRLAQPRNGRPGKTILLSSHLLADVEDVCDRVSIMFGGKIIEHGNLTELLTQNEKTEIETDALDDQTIQQIEQVLAQRGKHIGRVVHPRQSLEHKFLDLVKREQDKGTAHSGARAGGRMAQFLVDDERAGHLPEDVAAAQLLDELTAPSAAAAPVEAQAAPEGAPPKPDADAALLAQLSQTAAPEAQPSDSADQEAAAAEAEARPEFDASVIEGLVDADEPSADDPHELDASQADQSEADDSWAHDADKADASPADQSDADDHMAPEPGAEVAPEPAEVTQPPEPESKPPQPEPQPPSQPAPAPAPREPQVSAETGESGLGFLDAVADAHSEFDLPAIEPPPAATTPPTDDSEDDERPDQSFIEALENVDPFDPDDDEDRDER